MKNFFILVLASATLLSFQANASKEVGNGGDICEDRIKIVRDDIVSWINQGGAEYLKLPTGISLADYKVKMLAMMKSAKIACTEQTISIENNEKTCMNFTEMRGENRILCNFDRFNSTAESDQYVLVHHEFAGLAGYETTSQGDSNYELSNQLTGSLVDQVVKKLSVKPPARTACASRAIVGVYGGKFTSGYSRSDSFPMVINIMESGVDRSGCTVLYGYYERPDLVSNAGRLPLNVEFDEKTHELTLRSDKGSDTGLPSHNYLLFKGKATSGMISGNMQWWQNTGSANLTRCQSGHVNRLGDCTN